MYCLYYRVYAYTKACTLWQIWGRLKGNPDCRPFWVYVPSSERTAHVSRYPADDLLKLGRCYAKGKFYNNYLLFFVLLF